MTDTTTSITIINNTTHINITTRNKKIDIKKNNNNKKIRSHINISAHQQHNRR